MTPALAHDFAPPICARCGLPRPPDASPCARCGLGGRVCRWSEAPPSPGDPGPAFATRHEVLGLSARVVARRDGTWFGTGRERDTFTMPRGGPFATIDPRSPSTIASFRRWVAPERTAPCAADERAARATLLALTLGAVGAIELACVRWTVWGFVLGPRAGTSTSARLALGEPAAPPWATRALTALAEQLRLEGTGHVETTPWLDAVLRDPALLTGEEPTITAPTFPRDDELRALASRLFVSLASFLDP